MRAVLLFACLAVAIPDRPAPGPRKEAPRSFHDLMLGEWQFVKLNVGDGAQPQWAQNEVRTIRITPDEIQVTVNGMQRPEEGAAYKLDVTKQPAAIDMIPKQQIDNKDVHGIVKVEGDQLTLCFSIMGDRPTAFAASDKGLHAVMHLKRIKR